MSGQTYSITETFYPNGRRRVTITRYMRARGVLSEIRDKAKMPHLHLADLPIGEPVTFTDESE